MFELIVVMSSLLFTVLIGAVVFCLYLVYKMITELSKTLLHMQILSTDRKVEDVRKIKNSFKEPKKETRAEKKLNESVIKEKLDVIEMQKDFHQNHTKL